MYATIDEFMVFLRSQELVAQSNWESEEPFVNQEFANLHLELANAKINGALAMRFTVPIDPSPPQLRYICMRVAHWSSEQIGEIRQHVQLHYEDALADLEKIAKGEMALIGADGKPILPIVDTGEPGGFGDRVYTSVGQRGYVGQEIVWSTPRRNRPIDGERQFR